MTVAREAPLLSKSRFLAGLQCEKRLWLEFHAPELATPWDAGTQAILDAGTRVGEVARGRFPGGVLVAQRHDEHDAAVAATRRLLDDASIPAIYEAAFTEDGVRIRADALVRAGDAWDLVEVKASTRVKDEHVPDVAIQKHVLDAAGLRVRRAYLMHVDNTYVYPGGPHELEKLFHLEDLGRRVGAVEGDLPGELARLHDVAALSEEPGVATGPHCTKPHPCPFLDYCTRDRPEHPVEDLYRAPPSLIGRLREEGIETIADIPDGFPGLKAVHERMRAAITTGTRHVDPAARRALEPLHRPVGFLDFETIGPALPLYPGTRPYETIPFQWSLHVLREDGALDHNELLADGTDDPRRPFAEALIEAAKGVETFVVYSPYEKRCLRALAHTFPDLEGEIASIIDRLFDLLPVVRNHVYDPAFRGSFSIKKVLPALVPDLGYDGLDIADGGSASAAFEAIVRGELAGNEAAATRRALLEYCGRDTEAMVALYREILSG